MIPKFTPRSLLARLVPHIEALRIGQLPLPLAGSASYADGATLGDAVTALGDELGLDEDEIETLQGRVYRLVSRREVNLLTSSWDERAACSRKHSALVLPNGTVLFLFSDDDAEVQYVIVDRGVAPLDERQAHRVLVDYFRSIAHGSDGLDPWEFWGSDVTSDLTVRSPMLTAALDAYDGEDLPVEDPAFWRLDDER